MTRESSSTVGESSSMRLASGLSLLAGAGLLVASVLWDLFGGGAHRGFGRSQALGALAGIGFLLFSAVLSEWGRPFRRRCLSFSLLGLSSFRLIPGALLLVSAISASLVLSDAALLSASPWILAAYILAGCIAMPLRLGAVMMVLAVGIQIALAEINAVKIDLTGLPLTVLDVRLAAADPNGLLSALDLPSWTRIAAVVGSMLAAGILFVAVVKDSAGYRKDRSAARRLKVIAGRLFIILGVVGLAAWQTDRVFAEIGGSNDTWDIAGVTELSSQIGILNFLGYSYRAEIANSGDFFNAELSDMAPSDEEITAAARKFVSPTVSNSHEAASVPNVVVILAESTFDPAHAFDLVGDFRSSLFSPGDSTSAVGPLYVNAIGGGTWVTEFEVILGIDARVFGYSGYYTHASISPFVSRSFATYLRDKGYETWVFMPHEGGFYNYRAAYENYGFEHVLDSVDLRNTPQWGTSDTRLMRDFMGVMGPDPVTPFFAHVLLNENHGPHECTDTSLSEFPVRFSRSTEVEANCQLAEYLRRLESTTEAVMEAEDYLRDLERRTGRPYVLLVYGDHQPFSFTGEWGGMDFDPLRTSAPKNITFYHFLTSMPGRITCCEKMIPATLLPSLLSAYTSDHVEGLFLPVNLWLYDRCGYDAVGREPLNYLTAKQSTADEQVEARADSPGRGSDCEFAYRGALQVYRAGGFILAER